MSKYLKVPDQDWDFCESVMDAVFSNPFSPTRSRHFEKLLGQRKRDGSAEFIEAINEIVSERMGRWEQAGIVDLRRYRPGDRDVMRIVLLFETYHLFYHRLDKLIALQVAEGEESLPVPFAGDAIKRLERRGFSRTESVRFFGLFYQLRRAHYFITRGLIGDSRSMVELRRHLWNNVFTHDILRYDRYFLGRMEDFSTLLLGETGTGKGAAAAAIGRSGFIPFDLRRGKFTESFMAAFVTTNLSQFQENLIESELFGHRKGAFTGAVETHSGILSQCSGHGAVFLDEIGEVSEPIQIKLLRVLQERVFSPVGSREERSFKGRVIAATNQAVDDLRHEGRFRSDFYFRLCSDSITVPTLRQRLRESPGELNQLLGHLCARILGEEDGAIVSEVEQTLLRHVGRSYHWPGNVRELEQAVRRVLLTKRYDGVTPRFDSDREYFNRLEAGELTAESVLSGYCAMLYRRTPNYEAVARMTNLDRRTVKKYVVSQVKGT